MTALFNRTVAAPNYISPTDSEVREVAKRVGLNAYSPKLVSDIANVASGGEILPSAEYKDDLFESMPPPEQDDDGEWKYPTGYYNGHYHTTDNKELAQERINQHALRAQESICEFLRGIDYSNLTGDTPLEKACGLLKTLAASDGGSQDSVGGETLPIFSGTRADKQADFINSINEIIHTLDSEEKELLEDDDDDITQGGSGSGEDKITDGISLAEDMAKGRHWWLKISRELNSIIRFRVGITGKPQPDIQGNDVRNRQINDLSEMSRMTTRERVMPRKYRNFRAATHAMQVRERVSREGKKQLIYMIIDCSLSMKGEPQHKSGGVLFNRLKAVISDDAELYFRFFDTQLKQEYHAHDKKSAKSIVDLFRNGSFAGGGTSITECVRDSITRINSLMENGDLSERPELVIVTDGEDDTRNLTADEFKENNLRLHSFMVGNSKNKHLTKLARDTGGIGVDKL